MCSSLTNVTFGTNLITIGSSSFSGTSLTNNLFIPDSVTSIGNNAFGGCSELIYASIGNGVTNIGAGAFVGCTSLATVIMGTNVSNIGATAFQSCLLTSFTLPSNVTSIGNSAFAGCSGLLNVNISGGVTTIGSLAFSFCRNMTAIMVDPLNQVYSSVDGVLFDKSQATLIQCPGGKSGGYTISDGVTNIMSAAFYGCSILTNIIIPDGITSIGSDTFNR